MSFHATNYEHTCDGCGAVQNSPEQGHPKGWNFLYQRYDGTQPWCKELCAACLKDNRGIYTEYAHLHHKSDDY